MACLHEESAMKEVVIVSACRTAIGTFGGTLKDMSPEKIACATMKEAIRRAGIDPGIIDDVRFGCCGEPVDALNVARVSAILAGVPEHVPAVTINRVCISAMEAIISGMAMIQADMPDHVHTALRHEKTRQDARAGIAVWRGWCIHGLCVGNVVMPENNMPARTGLLQIPNTS